TKSGNTISYFVNGKEQLRTSLPAGTQGDLRIAIGGARGLVLLTDLYVEQHGAPLDLGAPPPGQAIAKEEPKIAKEEPKKAPKQKKGPRVELAGKDGATKIVGSAFDAQFKDMAPDGGLLIGFEFGIENNNAVKA